MQENLQIRQVFNAESWVETAKAKLQAFLQASLLFQEKRLFHIGSL